MKKKDLKKRISELESERNQLKDSVDMWKDINFRFIEELQNKGVKTEIKFPEPPIIEATPQDGMTTKYIRGMTTELPTYEFDFSKHDKEVMVKCE